MKQLTTTNYKIDPFGFIFSRLNETRQRNNKTNLKCQALLENFTIAINTPEC
jgi:hypothetical protein